MNRKNITGWGRHLYQEATILLPQSYRDCLRMIADAEQCVARGLGRSYGDSSLSQHVLDMRYLNHFIDFDEASGILTCFAGVTLQDILRVFVPKGWFLPVTPGTQYITVGGAIASDVHGKNHHVDGSFADQVVEIEMLLGNGECVKASLSENTDLFHATCGGMGLTGIILSASFKLKRIFSSQVIQTTIKSPDLDSVLSAFEDNSDATYSVAWIDCLARKKNLGRSILTLGEHASDENFDMRHRKRLSIGVDMPSGLLNHATVKGFNALYYAKSLQKTSFKKVPFEKFFYPLDRLLNWNRLYGKNGFVQYQFVVPKDRGVIGLTKLLSCIAKSGLGSFLAVLKVFGKGNANFLSFPMEGYTLALDFKVNQKAFDLMKTLDHQVLDLGGKLYLAKDAVMTEDTFKTSYPQWKEFEAAREKYHAAGKFSSNQSKRLGLK